MIYVDANIILDTMTDDPDWYEWSAAQLEAGRLSTGLVTGPIVAAEVGHYLESAEVLEDTMARLDIALMDVGFDAAWRAGQAFRDYRGRGGDRVSLLSDFMIGAHASAIGATMLTRDPRRFRSYFPDLALITPEDSE